MNLMPQEVEYTLARHPVHSSMLKLLKPCMIGYVCSDNLKEYLSYRSTT